MHGRGGCRQGAGRRGAWRHGATQTIRVPMALKDQLLEITRQLDNGELVGNFPENDLQDVINRWQEQCDAASPDAVEWKKVRQLLAELQQVVLTSTVGCRQGKGHRGQGHCHGHHHEVVETPMI